MCVCITWTNKWFNIINMHGATMKIVLLLCSRQFQFFLWGEGGLCKSSLTLRVKKKLQMFGRLSVLRKDMYEQSMLWHTEEVINFQSPGDLKWRSVFWYAFTDISKKHNVFIFRVELPTQTLANDQLDAQFLYFIIRLLQSSTCFEQRRAHHQEVKLY